MQAPCASGSQIAKQDELTVKLGRALLRFQDRLLEGNITTGSLCQVQQHHQTMSLTIGSVSSIESCDSSSRTESTKSTACRAALS